MKVYIATALSRAADHNRVRDALLARGHEITYDWTIHGSVKDEGEARIAEVAALEFDGVRLADVVIVLLPGGRGTHSELGMAVALGKVVIAVAVPATKVFHAGAETCAFYWASCVHRAYIDDWHSSDEINHIVRVAEQALLQAPQKAIDIARAAVELATER